jgi:hypothetical protein
VRLDRELALGLATLWDRELYRPLGYVRATDFVREHLGVQENRARWLARLGRYLRAVPELNGAFVQGRIGASQAVELGRIVDGHTPVAERREWIAHAAHIGVRALKKEVRAEIERREAAGVGSGAEAEDPDEPPPGGWISIPAPARVAVLWLGAVELARMVSGSHLTPSQGAEAIFAEYLSAFGSEEAPRSEVAEQRDISSATSGSSAREEVDGCAEAAAPLAAVAPTTAVAPNEGISTPNEDAWDLAERLIRIAKEKQRLRFELAGLLLRFTAGSYATALGYSGLEAYCNERLGFAVRRAERLMRFRRGLDRFPKLAAAHLAGEISYTAALLLLRILHPRTEERWVQWATGITYREIERVTERARPFAPPKATAFVAEDETALPMGCALPPEGNGLPRIVGVPEDLAEADPERPIARIRFWMPQDALEIAHRALDRCRHLHAKPGSPSWAVLEIILVHFIQTQDTPAARAIERRHKIIARDGFRCLLPGCTSCTNLQAHHLRHRAQGGTDHDWNQASDCAGHHVPGVHAGVIDMGGFAPDQLITRLGINPRTGRAFASYRNERRISDDEAVAALAEWRRFWRDRLERPAEPEPDRPSPPPHSRIIERDVAHAARFVDIDRRPARLPGLRVVDDIVLGLDEGMGSVVRGELPDVVRIEQIECPQ